MKILILGGSGMLGHKLVQCWKRRFEVSATIRGDFSEFERFDVLEKDKTFENIEVENINNVEGIIENLRPDVIVNAVGIIKQLKTSKNIEKVLKINSIFPHLLADIAEKFDSRLICISTDCVFDGEKGNYQEDDFPNAADLYGKSKNLGEIEKSNCLTLRTSIIGRELKTAHSLVEWFLSNEGKKVKGFRNAVYTGFPTIVLADILADIIVNHQELEGLYHLSSAPINKYELLKLIKKFYKANIEIEPDDDYKIDRSLDSTKFRTETNFVPQSWAKMIEKMARDEASYRKWKK